MGEACVKDLPRGDDFEDEMCERAGYGLGRKEWAQSQIPPLAPFDIELEIEQVLCKGRVS